MRFLIFQSEKWNALLKYDPEISAAAKQLRAFGDRWVEELGRAYFALEEDRSYLPNIVRKLVEEAESEAEGEATRAKREAAERWASRFARTARGEVCTEASLCILRTAESRGYVLSIDNTRIITATKGRRGAYYLYSNDDIEQFGENI
jgi:hypothetical protein